MKSPASSKTTESGISLRSTALLWWVSLVDFRYKNGIAVALNIISELENRVDAGSFEVYEVRRKIAYSRPIQVGQTCQQFPAVSAPGSVPQSRCITGSEGQGSSSAFMRSLQNASVSRAGAL